MANIFDIKVFIIYYYHYTVQWPEVRDGALRGREA